MTAFHTYLIPWTISQVVSIILLLLAIKRPSWMRWVFAVMFIAAGIFNMFTAFTTPEAYLMYADTAIGPYKAFINGWFGEHIRIMVPVIATGQILIGMGMIAGGRCMAFACWGIIVFLAAIAPLGVGSAFPFSVTVSIAVYLVYRYWRIQRKTTA
jgi:hypothetical protein